MKAIVHDRYGAPDVLQLRDVDQPVPGEAEVLVRVHAVSLNARDWHVMRGDPYLARLGIGLRRPRNRILGTDFAERVEAVGAAVTRFRPGDEVYGETERAFAEYVCAPETVVDFKPANLSFEQAAAVPLAANTALAGLREAGVEKGQRVLINGASGGVGTFAVQIAKTMGAEVIAVCSARNAGLVGSLGADRVIDYNLDDFTKDRYEVVFDLVGNRSLRDLRRALTPDGVLLLSGGGTSNGGSLIGPMGLILRGMVVSRLVRRHRIHLLTATPSRESLTALRDLIESEKVMPVVDRTYTLAQAPEAIRYMEVDHARAKVVLTG